MNDGRFAGPVGTDQAGNFSSVNDERHVVDRRELAVGFRQSLDSNEHRATVRLRNIDDKLLVELFFVPERDSFATRCLVGINSFECAPDNSEYVEITLQDRLKLAGQIRILPRTRQLKTAAAI